MRNLRPGDRGAARARVPRVRGRADGRLRALRDGPGVPDRARERGDRRAARAAGGGEHARGRVPPDALAGTVASSSFVRAQLQPQLNGNVAMPQQRDLVWVDLQACKILPFPLGRPRDRAELHAAQRGARARSSPGAIPPEHDPASQRSEGAATLGRYVRLGTNNPPVGAIGVPADLTPDSDPADPARGGDPAAAERAHHQRRLQRHLLLAALRPLPDARATRSRLGRAAVTASCG